MPARQLEAQAAAERTCSRGAALAKRGAAPRRPATLHLHGRRIVKSRGRHSGCAAGKLFDRRACRRNRRRRDDHRARLRCALAVQARSARGEGGPVQPVAAPLLSQACHPPSPLAVLAMRALANTPPSPAPVCAGKHINVQVVSTPSAVYYLFRYISSSRLSVSRSTTTVLVRCGRNAPINRYQIWVSSKGDAWGVGGWWGFPRARRNWLTKSLPLNT